MYSKRKLDLFDDVVNVLCENLHPDDMETIFVDKLGFTIEECRDYGIPIEKK